MPDIDTFLNRFSEASKTNHFIKLTLSARRTVNNELKNVFVKPVMLKSGAGWNFVYRYPTKDITKNYDLHESLSLLRAMLLEDFYKADLFTTTQHVNLTFTKSGKTILAEQAIAPIPTPAVRHDKVKHRYVIAQDNIYLYELGVTTADGKVKSDKQDKYRQINKYVEIVDSIIKAASMPAGFKVVDMGSGKGYLTFALYDHLTNVLKLSPEIKGIEMRPELVENCNKIALKAGFEKLSFSSGSIDAAQLDRVDMLIALHACDTATDEAIYRGIKEQAKIIICAPCCHKQLRKQMHPLNDLKAISDFGILEERQAEILTDTIRALILKAFGYKTKVFEFISTEHTPKNLLIVGVKGNAAAEIDKGPLQQIKSLKSLFNIGYHQLEKLMEL